MGEGAEFDAIRRLLRLWDTRATGIGDDAAILDVPSGQRLVISTDASVQNVHFRREWLSAEEIGGRATAAALSDLAAMAATPLGLLLALAVPDDWRTELEALARGVGNIASAAGCPIRRRKHHESGRALAHPDCARQRIAPARASRRRRRRRHLRHRPTRRTWRRASELACRGHSEPRTSRALCVAGSTIARSAVARGTRCARSDRHLRRPLRRRRASRRGVRCVHRARRKQRSAAAWCIGGGCADQRGGIRATRRDAARRDRRATSSSGSSVWRSR